jgi:hypothetical protein
MDQATRVRFGMRLLDFGGVLTCPWVPGQLGPESVVFAGDVRDAKLFVLDVVSGAVLVMSPRMPPEPAAPPLGQVRGHQWAVRLVCVAPWEGGKRDDLAGVAAVLIQPDNGVAQTMRDTGGENPFGALAGL